MPGSESRDEKDASEIKLRQLKIALPDQPSLPCVPLKPSGV
jgi:hypothetical protein